MNRKVIAVWGNAGAGKSMLSCALANQLTRKNHSAIVISTDKLTPMFASYLPLLADKQEYSLGRFLTGQTSVSALRGKIQVHPNNSNLGFMSLGAFDNSLIFQGNWRMEAIGQLTDIVLQNQLADYCIFDCGCDLFADNATLFALENAQAVIRVSSPDNRSISFYEAQAPIMRGGNFLCDQHISVLNNAYANSPVEQMRKDWNFEFVFPHSLSAYSKMVAGQLVQKLDGQEGYEFETELKRLSERVVTRLGG